MVAAFISLGPFFAPFVDAIPVVVTGPGIIVVGMLMVAPRHGSTTNLTWLVPAFAVIVMMILTVTRGCTAESGSGSKGHSHRPPKGIPIDKSGKPGTGLVWRSIA